MRFNHGWLVCLPHGTGEETPDGLPTHTTAQTRPISIVDAANRLIANAFRLRWEPLLEPWLSPLQRGFLPGRSMLANAMDVPRNAR